MKKQISVLFGFLLHAAFLTLAVKAQSSEPVVTAKPGGCNLTLCGGSCDGSSTCPVATIADGVALLPTGGTISLLAGTYTGQGNANVTLAGSSYRIVYVSLFFFFFSSLSSFLNVLLNHQSINQSNLSFLLMGRAQAFGIVFYDCAGLPGFSVIGGSAFFFGLTITNCHRPDGDGGAFYSLNSAISLSKMDAQFNSARRGGVLFVENGQAMVSQMSMENNSADEGEGAGIFALRSQVAVELVAIEQSTSGTDVGCEQGAINVIAPPFVFDTISCNQCSCPSASTTP